VRGIERAIGKKMKRVTLSGFDYAKKPAEKLEVPLAQRLAKIRSHRTNDRRDAAVATGRKTRGDRAGSGRRLARHIADEARAVRLRA